LRGLDTRQLQFRKHGQSIARGELEQKSSSITVRVNTKSLGQQRDAASSASEFQGNNKPVWIRVPEATRLFGVGRSSLYVMIAENKVRSRVLKSRRDATRGIRLLSYDSLCEFIGTEDK
jgi:hypothetical protein